MIFFHFVCFCLYFSAYLLVKSADTCLCQWELWTSCRNEVCLQRCLILYLSSLPHEAGTAGFHLQISGALFWRGLLTFWFSSLNRVDPVVQSSGRNADPGCISVLHLCFLLQFLVVLLLVKKKKLLKIYFSTLVDVKLPLMFPLKRLTWGLC